MVRAWIIGATAAALTACSGARTLEPASPGPAPAALGQRTVTLVQDDGPRSVALPPGAGAAESPQGAMPPASDEVAAGDAALAALKALDLGAAVGPLVPTRAWTWRGRTTVALQQLHGGVPVRGGGATVILDGRGRPTTVTSHQRAGLTVATTPAIRADEAGRRLGAALPSPPTRPLSPRLAVVGDRLLWEAHATTTSPPDAWRLSLPADGSGAVRVERRSHTALGRVYPLHPGAGEPEVVTLGALEPDATELTSPAADVWSVAWVDGAATQVRLAAPDEAGDFLFDPAPGEAADPFAEVSAYHHLERALAFFADRFGGAPPGPVSALVNYEEAPGEGYSNAYAYMDESGQFATVFGQIDDLDFAYSALIASHELGHPFFDEANDTGDNTDYPVNIDAQGIHSAPAAMNEGMSDYWAGAITGDVDVLAYIAEEGELERSLRRLDNATRCPDDLIGEAHMDGALLSTTLWELRGALGAEAIDAVAWALIHQLEGAPTFADAAALIRDDVDAMVQDGALPAGSVEAAEAILASRGIDVCARSVPLVEGAPRVGTAIGADTVAKALGMDESLCSGLRLIGARVPLVVSYVATVPDTPIGGLALTLTVERLDGEPLPEADALYEVVLRKGAPPELALVPVPLGGMTLSIPNGVAEADQLTDGSPTTVQLTTADVPLAPGDTVYVNILSAHCHTMRHTTALTWLPPAPPPVDAGAHGDADAGDAAADAGDAASDADLAGDAGAAGEADGAPRNPDGAAPPDAAKGGTDTGAGGPARTDSADPAVGDTSPGDDAPTGAGPSAGASSGDGCRAPTGALPGPLALLLALLLLRRRVSPQA